MCLVRRDICHENARVVGTGDLKQRLGRLGDVENPPFEAFFASVRDLRAEPGLAARHRPSPRDFRLHPGEELPHEPDEVADVRLAAIRRPCFPYTSSEHVHLDASHAPEARLRLKMASHGPPVAYAVKSRDGRVVRHLLDDRSHPATAH